MEDWKEAAEEVWGPALGTISLWMETIKMCWSPRCAFNEPKSDHSSESADISETFLFTCTHTARCRQLHTNTHACKMLIPPWCFISMPSAILWYVRTGENISWNVGHTKWTRQFTSAVREPTVKNCSNPAPCLRNVPWHIFIDTFLSVFLGFVWWFDQISLVTWWALWKLIPRVARLWACNSITELPPHSHVCVILCVIEASVRDQALTFTELAHT